MAEINNNLQNITNLDLSGQNLEEIPKYVFQCKNLRKLVLHNNKIRKISGDIKFLRKLRLLDLSNNNISVINFQILKLPCLRTLNMSYNSIISIPHEVVESQLEQLILIGNELKKVSLNGWSNLKKLNLSNNNVKIIELYGLFPNLEYLWIGNNPLQTILIPQNSLPKIKSIYTYSYSSKRKEANIKYQQLLSKRENVACVFWNQLHVGNPCSEMHRQSENLLRLEEIN